MMPRVWRPSPEIIETFDQPRRVLAQHIVEREEDLARLSTKVLGKNASYLWQYFARHKPRLLPEDARIALAEHFGIDQNQLRGAARTLPSKVHGAAINSPVISQRVVPTIGSGPSLERVPVLGRAIAGSAKILWEQGRPQEWVERPAYLSHPNAFAIFVNGESMQPRYYPGERVYVDPSKPLSRDCFVVVECKDDTAVIKQYIRHDDSSVQLRQLNPDRVLTISSEDIRAIHRIVGSSER